MDDDSALKKITEKAEQAKREWFKKVEKILKTAGHSAKLRQDVINQATNEYNKLFGRVGVHPLLSMKGGKTKPRYIVDRDEVWVLYKPPLWQMGGSEAAWRTNIGQKVGSCTSLAQAQQQFMETDKIEIIQEYHGLTKGLMYLDAKLNAEYKSAGRPEHMNWGFIQRLDIDTDGPVIICKTWRQQRVLQQQMKEHIITKSYMCLVHGRMEDKITYVNAQFAELGSDASSQIMLKHDESNDPFMEWSNNGTWRERSVRKAETFYKPIAYYHRKEDNSEYTLVYVNILTGITHQVRITMQSAGHPIVSDDRYLPKDQASSDLKWCPRNFLCEVRQDWFDCFGPYEDPKRRKYQRMSIENPLPKLFQHILETKLTLVEKLDPTADLYQGPQHWALGDEQLMARFPKLPEFRRKVIRWGMRRGIHLEALERLLILPKEDIDQILNHYLPPSDPKEESWVCPTCMTFNTAMHNGYCQGNQGIKCEGVRLNDDEMQKKLPKGWTDWASDPTMHLLLLINKKWLDARRKVLKMFLPSWQKPPPEEEGSEATPERLLVLEAALVLNAKAGKWGIREEDLLSVPGLENIQLPLADPGEDSNVRRIRLPGSGSFSRWVYTLNAKERIKHTAEYNIETKNRIKKPLDVDTGTLPPKQLISKEEKLRRKFEAERKAKEEADAAKEAEKEDESDEEEQVDSKPKRSAKQTWKKLESTSHPGQFYYFNPITGESSTEKPDGFEEKPPVWKRVESSSNRGTFYYFNTETGENRVDRPVGVEILNDVPLSKSMPKKEKDTEEQLWKRMESKSKPGTFYYFNSRTGQNESKPPVVDPPWKLCQSKSRAGQHYYFNEVTGANTPDPPNSARPAGGEKRPATNGGVQDNKRMKVEEGLPADWEKKESDTHKGKFYYVNVKTGKTSWTKPGPWERKESSSKPGSYYYVNSVTGETRWDAPPGF